MATTVEIDTIINTDRSEAGLRELNKSLKQLISLQSQVAEGSDQFKRLQSAINDTEGKIGDLNDSFQTLRGSGVERLNSSIGLLKDGFLNADPGKLTIGMEGLGSAMKAIPIFLLIEGAKLLFDNWEKLTAIFDDSAKQIKANEQALSDLNIATNANRIITDGLIISREEELKILERQNAPLKNIIDKITQINGLKQDQFRDELKKTDKEIANVLEKLKQAQSDLKNQTETESLLQFLGFNVGTTEADVKKLQDELTNTYFKREEIANKSKTQEIASEEQKFAKIDEANKKAEEARKKRIADFQEFLKLKTQEEIDIEQDRINTENAIRDKEIEDAKRQIEQNRSDKAAINQLYRDQEQEADAKLESKRRRDSENSLAYDNAFQQKTLNQKIDFIEQDRDTQLLNEDLTQKQRIAIIEKAENDIFQLKVKKGQEYVAYAQSASNVLNSLSAYRTQNENYEIQQQEYQKQASIQNDSIRTQQLIDQEELRKNVALNNANLTAEERERIAYDSETKQLAIANYSKDAQNKINADFAKKELEIKRQQFERNKKLQIVNGIINTAASVLQTLGSVPYPANIPLAILAGVAGAIQVATIANQKFDAGPTAIQTPQAIDTRGGLPSSSPNSPSPSQGSNRFNPTGNLVAGGQNNTTNSNGTIKVAVLESDIRDVTSKVNVLESRATFGD